MFFVLWIEVLIFFCKTKLWTDTCNRGRQVNNDLEKSIPRLTADDLDVLEKFIKLD